MNIQKWLNENCSSLKNKTIVITGTTGGIGSAALEILVSLEANIIVGVRNVERAKSMCEQFILNGAKIEIEKLDLADITSIKDFAKKVTYLAPDGIDALINNAGVLAKTKEILPCGYEKHFFVNFLAPIMLSKRLLPLLNKKENSKLIFLSSLSIFYTKIKFDDHNSTKIKGALKIYANSKKWLTYYVRHWRPEIKETYPNVSVNLVSPGISGTALLLPDKKHKIRYTLAKIPMSILFHKPKKACLNEIFALYTNANDDEWIEPAGLLGAYGYPKVTKLKLKLENDDIEKQVFEKTNKILSSTSKMQIIAEYL